MMWPGAEYSYQGKNITYTKSFDPEYDYFKRVDNVKFTHRNIVSFENYFVLGNIMDYGSFQTCKFSHAVY